MSKSGYSLWAKKEERAGHFYWLPLSVHLEDTMNVAGWLWNHWLSDGQRRYLCSEMQPESGELADEEQAENLVRFLGGIHDIGKATPAFQKKKSFGGAFDLDSFLLENLEKAGFTGVITVSLSSPEKSPHALAGQVLLHDYGFRDDITSIVGAHHGKPADTEPSGLVRDQLAGYFANYFQEENPSLPIVQVWKNAQNELIRWALSESGIEKIENVPKISQPAQVLLSGLVIMADWIASNTSYFPLFEMTSGKDIADLVRDSDQRFAEGMSKWFRSLPFSVSAVYNPETLYQKRFGFLPSELQRSVFDIVAQIQDPGIIVLEAPMGCGKTEMALAAAEQLAAKTGASGLFFGLPTQATSNGMFGRIRQWTGSLAEEYGDTSIRLVHGKAALNRDMKELREQTAEAEAVRGIDADGEASAPAGGTVSVNEWFSGRKTASLDDFVVGTADQFLLMALKQKHLALRHLGFSKKIVVVDEVHAYDAYMQQYLDEALRWAGAYRVPVILLSATLPAEIRKDLIRSYLLGKGAKSRDLKLQEREMERDAYPLVSWSDGNRVFQGKNFPKLPDKEIELRRLEEAELCETLSRMKEAGGVAGVIVNTVKRAQQIAETCREKFGPESVELLHSGFIATDRIEKEEKLLKEIGKGGTRPKGKIIIGTQVLEQSLDIDFDVLITDLCPMDLLIQRAGRLQRHAIGRPAAFENPVLYIMGESAELEFESGSEKIYGGYLLARTEEKLPKTLHIPSDVSGLVQDVYEEDPAVLFKTERLQERYEDFHEQFKRIQNRKNERAEGFRLANPKLHIRPEKNNLNGWLHTGSEAETEEAAYAQVRDTEETVEVIALKKCGSGYGIFRDGKDLSRSLEDPETDYLLAQQTIRLPLALTAYGKADAVIRELENYNRKYLPKFQDQPWLKGTLAVIFDEKNTFHISGRTIRYDSFLGLQLVGKEEEHEPV